MDKSNDQKPVDDSVHSIPALASPSVVTWDKYLKIEEEELRRGRELGKPREKLLTVEEMLKIAQAN